MRIRLTKLVLCLFIAVVPAVATLSTSEAMVTVAGCPTGTNWDSSCS